MYQRLFIILFVSFTQISAFAQTSIHIEESEKYGRLGELTVKEFDALSGFELIENKAEIISSGLEKLVFGYHPYWGGSNYLNYQWDLLSDLCYFSYEVDPVTGNASTIHDWLTTPAIDSAYANGTRVHLCVTIFSGHSTFFNSPTARQTLTNNLISLVKQRGAHGVSLDFEAVPSSQGDNMLDYIAEFAPAFHDSIPGGILSIAMPAVDWSGIFDVEVLNEYIDLFMIMGYDYYWNGSEYAGPVDPHYCMTSGYKYSVARTVSYYESEGMPLNKLLLGVPYYGREWPTAGGIAPSATTANGTARSWAHIKNNASGNYSSANKKEEPNSFGIYYAYDNNGWYQCFVNDVRGLERRFKMVNRRQLAGIGIWALGYDDGHSDLWQVIAESFAQGTQITDYDTIFDSGGPSWEYYNKENYVQTFYGPENDVMKLVFSDFDLEIGYDSLWVYSGLYPGGELLGVFSGSTLPPMMVADDVMSIRFKSDNLTTEAGWIAVIGNFNVAVEEPALADNSISVYPNPASDFVNVDFQSSTTADILRMYDLKGQLMLTQSVENGNATQRIDISSLPSGIYLIVASKDHIIFGKQKVVVYH